MRAVVGANLAAEMIRVANDGRTVEFPDRTHRMTFPVEKIEEYGDVALVWTEKDERDPYQYAFLFPMSVSCFRSKHVWYREGYTGRFVGAMILKETTIRIREDDFTTIEINGHLLYHLKSPPYSLIEDPLQRGFLAKYSSEKDDPRNLYMYGPDGALLWQLGANPWNPKFLPKEVFYEDETGKLFIQWDGLHLIDGYEVDVATGKIIAKMQFLSRNPLQYTVLETL